MAFSHFTSLCILFDVFHFYFAIFKAPYTQHLSARSLFLLKFSPKDDPVFILKSFSFLAFCVVCRNYSTRVFFQRFSLFSCTITIPYLQPSALHLSPSLSLSFSLLWALVIDGGACCYEFLLSVLSFETLMILYLHTLQNPK